MASSKVCDICKKLIDDGTGYAYQENVFLRDARGDLSDAITTLYDVCSLDCADKVSSDRLKKFTDRFRNPPGSTA